jgi:DNA polymerase-3 subunit epsilon
MFSSWFSKKSIPPFWSHYQALMRVPLSGNTNIRQLRFAVFDTETTGLEPSTDHILAIGGLIVTNNTIQTDQSLELYLQQSTAPQQQDIAIHGILPSTHAALLSPPEAIVRFTQWCGHAILVGHHLPFDLAMINKYLIPITGERLRNKTIDTLDLAMRVNNQSTMHRTDALGLDALASQYHIPLHDRHTAAGDAFITAILLLKLLQRLERRGVNTYADLMRRPGIL